MSKLRVRGALVTLILFTAVAVFSNVIQALGSNKASCQQAPCAFCDTSLLVADGGDPPPNPIPIPRPSQTA